MKSVSFMLASELRAGPGSLTANNNHLKSTDNTVQPFKDQSSHSSHIQKSQVWAAGPKAYELGDGGEEVTESFEIFQAKRSWFGQQCLGENIPNGFKASRLLSLTFALPKHTWRYMIWGIQVLLWKSHKSVKIHDMDIISIPNFHQQNNDKRIKANKKFCFCHSSEENPFKNFLFASYRFQHSRIRALWTSGKTMENNRRENHATY